MFALSFKIFKLKLKKIVEFLAGNLKKFAIGMTYWKLFTYVFAKKQQINEILEKQSRFWVQVAIAGKVIVKVSQQKKGQ